MINSIITLKHGEKGRVVGTFNDDEYILQSGEGGKITFFKIEDVASIDIQ